MNFSEQQEIMIKQQLRTVGVLDEHILQLYRDIPRHKFVPQEYESLAYADYAIPLAHKQFMLPPKEEAQILQALQIKPTDYVLEIGTGSGYMTALIAELAHRVKSIDIYPDLLEAAKQRVRSISAVEWQCADASDGLQEKETYDVIIISGAMVSLPESFKQALKMQGRLFAILGEAPTMAATLITRTTNGFVNQQLFETVAPYMVNASLPTKFKF